MCCRAIRRGGGGIAYLFGFDQITTDLIVEELDRLPLDALSGIFVLLGLECQLNEDLLQLLVDVVDAQLLESIFLQPKPNVVCASILVALCCCCSGCCETTILVQQT
jgi:hypothetical protein